MSGIGPLAALRHIHHRAGRDGGVRAGVLGWAAAVRAGAAGVPRLGGAELDVHGEQVGAEHAHVDRVQCAQRVPGDDVPLAGERVIVGTDGGDAGHPAVAQSDAQPHPDMGVVLDVTHVAGAGAVFGDDPERVALTAVADRNPAGLAGGMPPGFQDRQPERVDADREQQPHQRVDGVPLQRPDQQHLGAAAADGEQEQAQVDAGLHQCGQEAGSGMIAYGPHTRAAATSVPAISPRGTLKREPGRAVVVFRVGTVRSRGMVTPCRGVAGWLATGAARPGESHPARPPSS